VVDYKLKTLKEFDYIKDAKAYVKKNSPKDPRLEYGIYETILKS